MALSASLGGTSGLSGFVERFKDEDHDLRYRSRTQPRHGGGRGGTFVRCGVFQRDTGASASTGRHECAQFDARLRRHAVRQRPRFDRLPGATADRRSASHRFAAAESGGTRSVLAEGSRCRRGTPRGIGFAEARAANNAKYADRIVPNGASAGQGPTTVGWAARRMSSGRGDTDLPLCALESSEVHGDRR